MEGGVEGGRRNGGREEKKGGGRSGGREKKWREGREEGKMGGGRTSDVEEGEGRKTESQTVGNTEIRDKNIKHNKN